MTTGTTAARLLSLQLLAAAMLVPAAGAASASDARPQDRTPADIQALIDRYGCLSCHGLVRKQVGPGFAQVAARYRADAGASDMLAGRIKNGSVGHWGRVIMPNQPRMTEAESQALSRWVLGRPVP